MLDASTHHASLVENMDSSQVEHTLLGDLTVDQQARKLFWVFSHWESQHWWKVPLKMAEAFA